MLSLKNNRIPGREERAKMGKKARTFYAPLQAKLEREHWGEYISFNVENGDYVVAEDDLKSARAIKARYPGILPYTIRIGYKAIVHFGGSGVSDGIKS